MHDLPQCERALGRVLWHLRAYLPGLVLVGGWVPYLYRRYGGFTTWTGDSSLTIDVDVLITPRLPGVGGESLARVLVDAGFRPLHGGVAIATWVNDAKSGEHIEFLIAHHGTARQLGRVVPVAGHEGLGAISLDRLDLLHRHTSGIQVPIGRFGGKLQMVDVTVPRLGAFVINKALTFLYRPARTGEFTNPKRSQDLLYLHDLMAAGPDVVGRIEEDIGWIARFDRAAANDIGTSRNNLALVLNGQLRRALPEVADAVATRAGTRARAALADVEGHIADLLEIFDEAVRS